MEISLSEYERFRQLLESKSGILLGDNKQYLVTSRLSNFIQDNGIDSFTSLLGEIVRPSGNQLLQKVIDQMTTNETLWYRDSYPFEYAKVSIFPQLVKKGRFRIWSAACSSGQEPYSLAMLLNEHFPSASTELIATDLSSKVLAQAKQGLYQEIELKRGLPQDKLNRYFDKVEDARWQINNTIRRTIRFQSLNLLNSNWGLGKFDVIFCRNVLIYFSQENKTKVLNGLIDSLNPGGYLFLGASESLTKDCTQLKMLRCNPGLVYFKE